MKNPTLTWNAKDMLAFIAAEARKEWHTTGGRIPPFDGSLEVLESLVEHFRNERVFYTVLDRDPKHFTIEVPAGIFTTEVRLDPSRPDGLVIGDALTVRPRS